MFKIGEFSRLGQVTIDTLRHYDEVGLLKPVKVDSFTGYRYYSAKQLRPLHQILALKDLGFSLEEVARILQDELSDAELRGMLRMQLVSAERDLHLAQSRLDHIKTRLKSTTLEDSMSQHDVTVKPIEALTIVSIREVVPHIDQMPERCGALFDSIAQWLTTNKLPIGSPMTTYYNEAYTQHDIDMECAFTVPTTAVSKVKPPHPPMTVRELNAVAQMAVTIVTDDFQASEDGLTPAYHSLANWIETHNYKIVGPPRELFYGSPNEGDLTAEIQYPVEKA
ncbi:MAG: MerR family transcriptional regulator [Chloroflexota bacterium]